MLLKLAMWYINRTVNNMPTGIGRIDGDGTVTWPANG